MCSFLLLNGALWDMGQAHCGILHTLTRGQQHMWNRPDESWHSISTATRLLVQEVNNKDNAKSQYLWSLKLVKELTRVTLYTAGHMHTAVPHCWHSRAPIVDTAVPRENNEHGCVYLRCRAVCKLPGCVEGRPCLPVTKSYIHQYVVTNFGNDLIPTVPFPYGVALKSIFMSSCFDECPFMWMVFINVVFSLEESRVILTTARFKEEIQLFDYLYKDSRFLQFQKGGAQICHIKPLTCNWP